MTKEITLNAVPDLGIPATLDFDAIAGAIQHDVAATTYRVYSQTYRAWSHWCDQNNHAALALNPDAVRAFLASKDTTTTTRKRQLSALRKLADKLHTYAVIAAPGWAAKAEALAALLADVKPPSPDATITAQERDKRALTPAQADRVLRAWDSGTNKSARNRALVAVLLLAGLRRSEAVALQWRDVDFENGVLTIRHGKGDKFRQVPVAGDFALDALRRWQARQPSGFQNVFVPVYRGDKVSRDQQLAGTDVYRIVKQTEALTGVVFAPHDARRTLITEALGHLPTSDVQSIAGHARAETTLNYAQTSDARMLRKKIKLNYG